MTEGWGPGTGYDGGSSWRAAGGIGLVDFSAFQTYHGGRYERQGAELRYARIGAREYGRLAVASEGTPAQAGFRLTAGPNPVRAATTLRFTLPDASDVRLAVVDALGRTVRRLDVGARPAGAGEAVLPASGLAPGVYTVRLEAGARSAAVRVVVVP